MQENRHIAGPPRFEPAGEGRIHRGFRLLGLSWRYLREEPRLLVLPAITVAVGVLALLLFFLPVLWATRGLDFGYSIAVAGLIALAPLTFIGTFFNVAFLWLVQARLDGRVADVRAALRFARSRRRAILGWTVMATIAGAILQALQQIPWVGQWLGSLLSFVGGLAWTLATFFVVPVMVVEGVGARESVRRSAHAVRSRWGEAVVADFSMGTAAFVLAVPGLVMAGIGGAMYADDVQVAAVLVTAGLLMSVAVFTLTGAMTQLFQLLLYRHTTGGEIAGPFSEADLATAVRPKRGLRG